ncbi:MAG: hypothetical protein ACTSUD_09695, partial [Alphaproteobacteria bacterium]
ITPVTASGGTVESSKFGVWTYTHFIGDIEWCGVSTDWPNDTMVLTIRLRRNTLDFYFFNADWSLMRGQSMGDTVFVFDNHRFYASSDTLDSDKAVFGTFQARISKFVAQFKRARNMRLELPTDQSIDVNLKGSSKAMDAALQCWERYLG